MVWYWLPWKEEDKLCRQ